MRNFGGNIHFRPRDIFYPATEEEVLAYLDEHKGRRIRAIGSRHSWSAVAVSDDVVLDLRHLGEIRLGTEADGQVYADIEAGCTIDRALQFLHYHGYTLPPFGMFGQQTIAGAIATATHGSGAASLSDYVRTVRVAAYCRDTGKPRVYEWGCGDALLAARCGLGCTGIVLSVRMQVTRDYLIEERSGWYDRIDDVLEQENVYPLQQFYLIPWSWRWFAQRRRPLRREPTWTPSLVVMMRRASRLIFVDLLFNGALKLLSGTLHRWGAVRYMHRRVFPKLTSMATHSIDEARHTLQMHHHWFRHVEMELFVPAPDIVDAATFVEQVLRFCGGEGPPPDVATDSRQTGELEALPGYVHDHAITVRRVLRDEALISMTSGETAAWYAISLITYQRDIHRFEAMCAFVARTLALRYGARPHWGKFCPLAPSEVAALFPGRDRFRAHCTSVDPGGVFLNDFTRRALGFEDVQSRVPDDYRRMALDGTARR